MSRRWRLVSRPALIRVGIIVAICGLIAAGAWWTMITMPGKSYRGELPSLTATEQSLQVQLRQDVESIAGVGQHNYVSYDNLLKVANFIESSFATTGREVASQTYTVNGQEFRNLEIEVPGTTNPEEIVVIGAHYDSVVGSPGANDNGTGVAATLALARTFASQQPAKTLRFVAFVNEEPPFFWTENMGSLVYAKRSRERQENIVAMLSLETIGYYSDEPGSQTYPLGLLNQIYPITGDFIAFIGNINSRKLVHQVIASFRKHTQFPSEGSMLPNAVPGAGWSDHWSFWQQEYPALMVTDTAPFRYPYYHTTEDTPDKINYEYLARVVAGLERVVEDLVN